MPRPRGRPNSSNVAVRKQVENVYRSRHRNGGTSYRINEKGEICIRLPGGIERSESSLRHPLLERASQETSQQSKTSHIKAFFTFLMLQDVQFNDSAQIDYNVLWNYGLYLCEVEQDGPVREDEMLFRSKVTSGKALLNYMGSALNIATLSGLIANPNSEIRKLGTDALKRILPTITPEGATVITNKTWAKLLKLTSRRENACWWLLLGWRLRQFTNIESITFMKKDGTRMAWVTMMRTKGRAVDLPGHVLICRCDMYEDRPCLICTFALPDLLNHIDLAELVRLGISSHSFRRTLAVAIDLALTRFRIHPDPVTINRRCLWFEVDKVVPATHLTMMKYYARDSSAFRWEDLPELVRFAAIEIIAPPATRIVIRGKSWTLVPGKSH
jgi:hypothetical protein